VLGLAALEAIRDHPSVLFGPDQATAYQRQLGAGASDVARLRNILTAVLDLRLSIADRVTVARILSDGARETDPTEDLIDALAPDHIDLHLHPDYLRDLTEADPRNEANLFSSVREQLFLKLGITPPRCRFVMDESLPPQTFAFGLNHLRTPVLPGLPPPGPDEAGNVRLAINEAIAQGWVPRPWDPPMHLVVALAARLHAHASCFLIRRTVGAQLDQLELAFPELVQATRALISVEQVARVLRELVLQEVSVRNLRGILEQMLDYADTSEPW
jgi:flagellar biosynthesis component FlhA